MCDTCRMPGDHTNQMEHYPIGSTVVLLQEVPSGDSRLPIGSVGHVTSYCDDGRAIIIFSDHPKIGHTFHHPETHLAIAFPKDHEQYPEHRRLALRGLKKMQDTAKGERQKVILGVIQTVREKL